MDVTSARERMAAILSANNVLLAPMAGITDAPFRAICKQMGAGLTYTEMVSAKGLHYNGDSRASQMLLTFSPAETPCAVQLFGCEPEMMAEQAARITERYAEQVALIDINMGCPVTKVVRKGEGSALMREPELAATIVRAVVKRAGVPVTVKFRSGWDAHSRNAVEFGRLMEEAGAAALAVHGRTRSQFYKGEADWDVIAEVKQAVSVPVIGSGDVFSACDVVSMIERTGVDAVMVARGAQGDPWIFREARALLAGRAPLERPGSGERIEMALKHARSSVDFAGERAIARMRKHVAWYVSGLPDATEVRDGVNRCTTIEDVERLLTEYRSRLEAL